MDLFLGKIPNRNGNGFNRLVYGPRANRLYFGATILSNDACNSSCYRGGTRPGGYLDNAHAVPPVTIGRKGYGRVGIDMPLKKILDNKRAHCQESAPFSLLFIKRMRINAYSGVNLCPL
jgi:hypothetical protein